MTAPVVSLPVVMAATAETQLNSAVMVTELALVGLSVDHSAAAVALEVVTVVAALVVGVVPTASKQQALRKLVEWELGVSVLAEMAAQATLNDLDFHEDLLDS